MGAVIKLHRRYIQYCKLYLCCLRMLFILTCLLYSVNRLNDSVDTKNNCQFRSLITDFNGVTLYQWTGLIQFEPVCSGFSYWHMVKSGKPPVKQLPASSLELSSIRNFDHIWLIHDIINYAMYTFSNTVLIVYREFSVITFWATQNKCQMCGNYFRFKLFVTLTHFLNFDPV